MITISGGTPVVIIENGKERELMYNLPDEGGITPTGSQTFTENGTYDVTTIAEAIVNVSGGDTPVPADGKTRIWVKLADDLPENRRTFRVGLASTVEGGAVIDWGDNSTPTVTDTTSRKNYSHVYTEGGDYIISITVNEGTVSLAGTLGSSGSSIYGSRAVTNYHSRSLIKKVIFGNNITDIQYSLYFCYSTYSITLPIYIVDVGNYAFSNDYSLLSINLPDGLTSIGEYTFQNCYSLTSLTIPSDVTSIGNYAFAGCYGMSEYHFKPTNPPTIGAQTFLDIPSDCKIYVPQNSLSAYKSASNWNSQSSKIFGE